MFDLYLASKSPRRLELLQQIGVQAKVISVDCDESVLSGEAPVDYVTRVSKMKAKAGWALVRGSDDEHPVLAADTAVIVDDQILGKPEDFVHAKTMWKGLSNRKHQVLSAVVVRMEDREVAVVQESIVSMREISEKEMQLYWDTGEPHDKAGGYAVQGLAACFIENISGSYSGVMGLPLFETAKILERFNIPIFR